MTEMRGRGIFALLPTWRDEEDEVRLSKRAQRRLDRWMRVELVKLEARCEAYRGTLTRPTPVAAHVAT
jgi:hypothetical protein